MYFSKRIWRMLPLLALLALGSDVLTGAPALRAAPDLALPNADGTTIRLSAQKGKVVLVDFWASWCAPCKTSIPALDALYREYQPHGFEVLAINLDEQRRAADSFLSDRQYLMTVLFDPNGASPTAFDVKGMPSSFLIDKAGNIRFVHMGYSAAVDESYRREIAQLLAER